MDFLAEKQREIARRLQELKPIVEEYGRLQAAAGALASIDGASATQAAPRGPGRPRATRSKAPARKPRRQAAARAGRRKGSGTRAAQTLALVTAQPGITIPELAVKMGIKQTYLYRVLPGLEQESKVKKQGRGWHAAT
jgi:hypothetical protein